VLAQATLKSPYLFDFLSIGKDANEREVEKCLIAHMEKILLELGGRQYHLQVEEQDFYIDLLFYHIKLRAFVVIELKSGKFMTKPIGIAEYKLNDRLPDNLKTVLPTIEELEAELAKNLEANE
jgi:predicted nuclease of restriction endonuclease-like (RecB) superfamily